MPVYLEFELLERFDTANMTVTYYDNRGDFGGDLSILRLVLVFFGLSSNVIVATVLAGNRKMHTAPNCYVLSIVTSDFIVLTDVLWNVLISWFKFSLRIDGSYVACMTMEASMITIVVFTLERYDALCSPRPDAHRAFRFCNGLKSVLIIWSMSATFPALELNLNLHFLPDTQALIFIMSTTMFLLVPTLVILALVGFILFDTRNLKNDVEHDVSKVFGESSSVRTTFAIAILRASIYIPVALAAVFYVSMAPYRMVSLVRFISPTLCCSQTVLNGSYLIVELSAAVNPILYGFVSKHFRTALKVHQTKCYHVRCSKSGYRSGFFSGAKKSRYVEHAFLLQAFGQYVLPPFAHFWVEELITFSTFLIPRNHFGVFVPPADALMIKTYDYKTGCYQSFLSPKGFT